VVWVRWIVDEAAALLEPRLDRVPGDLHVTRCLRLRDPRKVTDGVGGERVRERPSGAVNEERGLGVDHRCPADRPPDAAGMRLDVHDATGRDLG
jgi:hypothetical protein